MRVLVINCYEPTNSDAHVVAAAIEVLHAHGNEVEQLVITSAEFGGSMTPEERRSYESDEPLIAPETKASAAAIQRADAVLFCYPTTLFGLPAQLKNWLDRVLVPGVAFVFDDKNRVRPGLRNIRRLGVITTTSHSLLRTVRARDLGRRIFMRTLRLNCNPRCRRTFVRVQSGRPTGSYKSLVRRRLIGWR